jgi:predicted ester cyclase
VTSTATEEMPMNQDLLVATARSLFDAFNARDLSLWERALAPGFVADYPGATGLDRAAAKAFNTPFLDAFSNLRFTVHRTIVQGNTVVFDGDAGGTFDGTLQTPDGPVPPNNHTGKVRIVLIAEVKDGKIVREQTVWNQLELFQQLGLIPSKK